MRFELTTEQRALADTLDRLLTSAEPAGVARAWARGDTSPGLDLWSRLADHGVPALLVPDDAGGLGASPVELVVAFEALGRHVVPGPWVESAAWLPVALGSGPLLASLVDGAVGTVAVPPQTPYALDAHVAEHVLVAVDGQLHMASVGADVRSVDRTRRLSRVDPGSVVEGTVRVDEAFDTAALATAAQLLGAGERALAMAVSHAPQRRQFGREIGSYQAVKHLLADVRIALDLARPLVYGAAVGLEAVSVSAAKVACADAARLAARTALQVHGAIGYTEEHDLSLWLTRIQAWTSAWGTPAYHRDRVLRGLLAGTVAR